jgi:outer membrane lipase/esterase
MLSTLTRTIQKLLILGGVWVLVACGAGSTKDPFTPSRIVSFGDAFSDRATGARYTVNGSTVGVVDNWVGQVAASYGVTTIVTNAVGNARITNATGAGGAAVTSITAQATGFTHLSGDLVLVNAGISDIIVEAEAANTLSVATANATALGTAYADLIRAIVGAGAKHVLAVNMYDLSRTPYQSLTGKTAYPLSVLSRAFNDALKTNLGDPTKPNVADNVRLVELELYMNQVVGAPASYGYVDATTVVCSTVDVTNGIGAGVNQINSKNCNTTTLTAPATLTTFDTYVFADSVYPTPAFHRGFGVFAQNLALLRW